MMYDEVMEFQELLNSIEPSIKFTVELESGCKLAFLVMEIHHHEDGRLTTTLYRKKPQTDKCLQFDSHNPMAHKQAVVKTLFNRANRICSSLCEKE